MELKLTLEKLTEVLVSDYDIYDWNTMEKIGECSMGLGLFDYDKKYDNYEVQCINNYKDKMRVFIKNY